MTINKLYIQLDNNKILGIRTEDRSSYDIRQRNLEIGEQLLDNKDSIGIVNGLGHRQNIPDYIRASDVHDEYRYFAVNHNDKEFQLRFLGSIEIELNKNIIKNHSDMIYFVTNNKETISLSDLYYRAIIGFERYTDSKCTHFLHSNISLVTYNTTDNVSVHLRY